VQASLDAWSVLQNVGVWLGVRGARQTDPKASALQAAAEREGVAEIAGVADLRDLERSECRAQPRSRILASSPHRSAERDQVPLGGVGASLLSSDLRQRSLGEHDALSGVVVVGNAVR
jgi:hypothetical protein